MFNHDISVGAMNIEMNQVSQESPENTKQL